MDIKGLLQYVDRHTRHNLLFVKGVIEGARYVDIGRELSERICDKLDNRSLPMICDDALNEILDCGTSKDEAVGSYVAICNIGILFEPALLINVHDKFEQCSREQVMIVNLEGSIAQKTFFLGQEQDSRYSIPLTDITYRTIYDSIEQKK